MFLFIGLFLDVFQWIFLTFSSKNWVEGFRAIPILALGNIFLGVYYNLSIWYKLTNKNTIGAMITIAGAIITIGLNILLIPKFHYYGAAVATFSCYFFMMISSYKLGQKYYPVPYAVKKLTAYIVLVVLIYLTHWGLNTIIKNQLWFSIGTAFMFLYFFIRFVGKIEAKELSRMPFVGRFYKVDRAG
jgi:O-antigen/teichoic acid export membrane protein